MGAFGGYLFKILHPTPPHPPPPPPPKKKKKEKERKKKVAYIDTNFIRVQNNYVSLNKLKIKK